MPHSPGISAQLPVHRRDHHVARARADDLHQHARPDARPDGAHVRIERADGHGHARRQPDFLRHGRGQMAGHAVGGHHFGRIILANLWKIGVERGKKLGARQAAPFLAVHRFVAGRADAALHRARIRVAGDEGRDEIGQLDPTVGGSEDGRIFSLAMPYFRPVPLAGVRAAADRQVAIRIVRCLGRDFGRLGVARVILPQPGLRGELLLELRLQCERGAVLIDRQRRGTRRIDADADDVFRLEAPFALRGRNRTADRREKAVDVIGRALPREIRIFLIEQHARIATGIIVDVRGKLIAVFQVDHQSPDAIGAVVDSDGKSCVTFPSHACSDVMSFATKQWVACLRREVA